MRHRDGQHDPAIGRQFGRAPVQAQNRRRAARDLDVAGSAAASERLDRRLLGGEPGGEVTTGAAPDGAGLELAGTEEPFGEPRSAVESTLDPIDLDQVDPERRDARDPGHGVITAEVVESLPSG
jgi:hypothetical protein